MAIHLDPQLDHARGCAPVDHHIIHRQRGVHAMPIPHDLCLDQVALVLLVNTPQHRLQCQFEVVERDIRNKTQAALVDADQWNPVLRQLASDTQHGAVAPHHQAQVAGLADFGHGHCGERC